ncbi:hypothetical protein EXS71_02150 [Candidatus Uhrbacteria bacterium]|nr:hypothetical protein [Candidatus Uhrbacteria bacterium]
MYISPHDLLYFAGAISLVLVTIFFCWVLYEIARLIKQANDMVGDTRKKIERVENAIALIGEKLGMSAQYLSLIAAGGKQLLSFLYKRSEKEEEQTKRGKKKKGEDTKLSDLPDNL